jgi:hypothetical protein
MLSFPPDFTVLLPLLHTTFPDKCDACFSLLLFVIVFGPHSFLPLLLLVAAELRSQIEFINSSSFGMDIFLLFPGVFLTLPPFLKPVHTQCIVQISFEGH